MKLEHKRLLQILGISLLLLIVNLVSLWLRPPVDADSYEYASVARNYLEQGALVSTHVQGHFSPHQELPYSSWNRATLWTFILMPFQSQFGDSHWVVSIPNQISVFLLGPATYWLGLAHFTPNVAFAAALATMLNHRIGWWSTMEDPGLADLSAVVTCLFALGFVLRRRWMMAGMLTGISGLLRLNTLLLIPAVLAWLFSFKRQLYRTPAPYIFCLVAMVFVSPHFIRSSLVFGNPIHFEQGSTERGSGYKAAHIACNYSALQFMFAPETYYDSLEMPSGEVPNALESRLRFAACYAKTVFFGANSGLAFYPGLFELIGPICVLLLPFTFIAIRRRQAVGLLYLYLAANLVLFITVTGGYEDRYLFIAVPICLLAVFDVVQRWQERRNISSNLVIRLLIVILVVEAIPHLAVRTVSLLGDYHREAYAELNTICNWVEQNTAEDTMLMTIPFWSPHYFCHRSTVPPVLGNLDELQTVLDTYDVDYVMLSQYWKGDRLPYFSTLDPVIQGKHIDLYRIASEPATGRKASLADEYSYMREFNLLDYFWNRPMSTRMDPLVFHAALDSSDTYATGVLLWVMIMTAAWFISGIKSTWKIAGLIPLTLFCFAMKLNINEQNHDDIATEIPSLSRIQAGMYGEYLIHQSDVQRLLIRRPDFTEQPELAFKFESLPVPEDYEQVSEKDPARLLLYSVAKIARDKKWISSWQFGESTKPSTVKIERPDTVVRKLRELTKIIADQQTQKPTDRDGWFVLSVYNTVHLIQSDDQLREEIRYGILREASEHFAQRTGQLIKEQFGSVEFTDVEPVSAATRTAVLWPVFEPKTDKLSYAEQVTWPDSYQKAAEQLQKMGYNRLERVGGGVIGSRIP